MAMPGLPISARDDIAPYRTQSVRRASGADASALIAAIEQASSSARWLLVSMLSFGLLALVVVANTDDEMILRDSVFKLPQVGFDFSISTYFVVLPLVFTYTFCHFVVYWDRVRSSIDQYYEATRELSARNIERFDAQVPANLFVQARLSNLRNRPNHLALVLAGALMLPFPLVVLLVCQIGFLRAQNELVTLFQQLLFLVVLYVLCKFYADSFLRRWRSFGQWKFVPAAFLVLCILFSAALGLVYGNVAGAHATAVGRVAQDRWHGELSRIRLDSGGRFASLRRHFSEVRLMAGSLLSLENPIDQILCNHFEIACRYLRLRNKLLIASDNGLDKSKYDFRFPEGTAREIDRKDLERITGIGLSGRQLRFADLGGSLLYKANLSFADLSGATLWGARAEGARLYGAMLHSALLQGVRLKNASLQYAEFHFATLNGIDFREWSLAQSGASFVGAKIAWADFSGVDVTDVNFQDADLSRAKMNGTHVSYSFVAGCAARVANDRMEDRRQEFGKKRSRPEESSRLNPRDIDGFDVGGSAGGADAGGADLNGCCGARERPRSVPRFSGPTTFRGARLESADLTGANFPDVGFEYSDLSGAKLVAATLCSARLQRAVLVNADARSANFGFAKLQGADLARANLEGARLYGADLRSTRISWLQDQERDDTSPLNLTDLDDVRTGEWPDIERETFGSWSRMPRVAVSPEARTRNARIQGELTEKEVLPRLRMVPARRDSILMGDAWLSSRSDWVSAAPDKLDEHFRSVGRRLASFGCENAVLAEATLRTAKAFLSIFVPGSNGPQRVLFSPEHGLVLDEFLAASEKCKVLEEFITPKRKALDREIEQNRKEYREAIEKQ